MQIIEFSRELMSTNSSITTTKQQQQILLKIGNITNYITFPSANILEKLIEAGGTEDILQVQGLSIDGLNNSEDTVNDI